MANLEAIKCIEDNTKDAIVACAREEVKKAIFDLCSVNRRDYYPSKPYSATQHKVKNTVL